MCQAFLSRATKQLMTTPRGRRPPPTPGGGSGLSYHSLTERCLASGGVRRRRQGTVKRVGWRGRWSGAIYAKLLNMHNNIFIC